MKIAMFGVREDEESCIQEYAQSLGVEVVKFTVNPSLNNLDLVNGCEGVSVLGHHRLDALLLDAWKERGVGYISCRTVGYEQIDLEHTRKIGMKVCNANYAPNGVADFTVMLMLMCLRHYKAALWRGQVNDYSLSCLQGREMRDLTVGVLGTGRIGRTVLKNLSGFGCRLLAYDTWPNDEARALAEYVDLDTLYRECDIITLHIPGSPEAYHMIDRDAISRMKDGVIIINCARGELADLEAFIWGVENKKIGALGLDVVEGERDLVHFNHRDDILSNKNIAYLRQFPNVVMTQHFAFYTDSAVRSMVKCGIEGIVSMKETGTYITQLK